MRFRCSVFVLLCPLAIDAQVSHPDTVHTISEVIVNGFHTSGQLLSSSPVQTLTHSDMERLGIHDMGDALKRFAGVQVKDYGGVGGIKTVNIRGLGAGHTGVIYDGVQVGDCQSGQIDLSRFTLDNISLISLHIGQDDDIYQSAKAFTSAGVINISTVRNNLQQEETSLRHPQLSAVLQTGSYGLFAPSLLYSQQFSKLGISAYGSYERADGVYRFKLQNGIQTINEKRYNSDIETWRGELNLSYRLSDKQDIKWKAYGFSSHRGLPGAVIYDNPYAAERLADKNFFTQLFYENRFTERIKLKAAAKWNYAWSRYSDVPAGGYKEDKYRQNETYLTATLWTAPIRGLQLSLSQDFAHNYLSMTLPQCPYPTRNSLWTALAANYTLGQFVINASLLATHIHESVKRGEASDGFHRMSPAFSLQWKANSSLRFRFGYKDIFRTPTLNELYYTGAGNRQLNPEKSRQWNMGATFNHSFNHNIYMAITADGYIGHVTDKIIAVPKMFYWQMMNAGKVRMIGADVTANLQKRWNKEWSVSLTGSYSYLSATDRTSSQDVFFGDQIAYTPEHSGSASVLLHTPWGDLSYSLLAMGKRYSLGYAISQNRMAGFTDHSITLSKELKLGTQAVKAQLDIRNLGGHNYEIVRFYPMPGTNWRLALGWML